MPVPDVWPSEAEELAAVLGPFVGRHEGLWTVLVRWQRWRLIHARQQRAAHLMEQAHHQLVEMEVCGSMAEHRGQLQYWLSAAKSMVLKCDQGRRATDQMVNAAHHKDGPKMRMATLVSAVSISRKCSCSPVPSRGTQHKKCLTTCLQHLAAPLLERFVTQARDTQQWRHKIMSACPFFEICLAMLQGRHSSAADLCSQPHSTARACILKGMQAEHNCEAQRARSWP